MLIFTTTRIWHLDKEKGEWTIYAKLSNRDEQARNRPPVGQDRQTSKDHQQIGSNDHSHMSATMHRDCGNTDNTKVTLGENMVDREELRQMHAAAKEKAINGEPQKNMIYGTVLIPTSKYWTVQRPADWDAHQFVFHTRYQDYNDPMPVLREINTIIAKMEQMKISLVEAWKREFASQETKETKVTLADEIEQMVADFDTEVERRKRFAAIARPLFEEIWKENVRGPNSLLKAFGVCAQHYEELKHACGEGDCNYDKYKAGEDVEFMMYYKGVPIVEHQDARFDKVVPIYSYGRLVTRKLR